MRIWGYVVLGIGVLFLILFGLAEFGGGQLGVLPFFISFFLVITGWTLITSGKGIAQTKTAAATNQSAAPAGESPTVEMPLTTEVAASIVRQTARAQRILLYVVGGCVVFFGGLGALIGASDETPGEGRTLMAIFAGLGVVCALLIFGMSWLSAQKPVRRDLHGASYLRTKGPVQVVPMFGGAMLRLADRAFLMNGRGGMAELSRLGWGMVDYTPHGHVILGACDRAGRIVYCLPGYSVVNDANGTESAAVAET